MLLLTRATLREELEHAMRATRRESEDMFSPNGEFAELAMQVKSIHELLQDGDHRVVAAPSATRPIAFVSSSSSVVKADDAGSTGDAAGDTPSPTHTTSPETLIREVMDESHSPNSSNYDSEDGDPAPLSSSSNFGSPGFGSLPGEAELETEYVDAVVPCTQSRSLPRANFRTSSGNSDHSDNATLRLPSNRMGATSSISSAGPGRSPSSSGSPKQRRSSTRSTGSAVTKRMSMISSANLRLGNLGVETTKESTFASVDESCELFCTVDESVREFNRRAAFIAPKKGFAERLVSSTKFDIVIAVLILMNGVSIGVQTDYMARVVTEHVPIALRVIEIFFCSCFTLELLLRIVAEKVDFVIGAEWRWNLFDSVVVTMQLVEETMGVILSDSNDDSARTNFSFMRVLRVLRLIRIVRIVRVLRLISELRTIVTSIASSMKHLLWTVVLLLLMIYTIAVYFTQLVLNHRLGHPKDDLETLIAPWGSLGRSAVTLYASISGGIDWDSAMTPMIDKIHILLGPLFCMYIAFAILAVMNVVTGVFVQNAIESANRDKERNLVQSVRELFEKANLEQAGVISYEEFSAQLSRPELHELLKGSGIDHTSAKSLFKLLDIDNSGTIDANELLTGTLRLRGEARSVDLAALIYESRRSMRRVETALSDLNSRITLMARLGPS